MRPFIPALTVSTLAALFLLLAGATAAPIHAQEPPSGGQIIENLIFETVVVEDVTAVTERTWGQATLDGSPTAEQPAADETAAQFAARIGAASCAETLVDTSVDSRLEDTTFEATSEIAFEASDDAVIVGDLADWPNILVTQGTLTVTETVTTIETQHITVTTTETYDLTCVSAQEGGQIVENLVFEHVVVEDVTEVTEVAWGQVTLNEFVLAMHPVQGETLAQFADRIGAESCAETLVDTTVASRLDETTSETVSDVTFEASEDAVIVGDLANFPDIVVEQGILIVTFTDTLVETHHITETTIETYDLACATGPTDPSTDKSPPATTGGTATSLPNAGTGAAAPGGDDAHAASLLTLLLPLVALAYRRCRRLA